MTLGASIAFADDSIGQAGGKVIEKRDNVNNVLQYG